jgi:hypothetical protein
MNDQEVPSSRRSSARPIAATPRKSTTLPLIAYSLDAGDQKQRLADWSSLLQRATRRDEVPDGVRYTFAATDELEPQLRALTVAETACCSFLDFDIARTGEALHMTVTAPPDALTALRFIFRAT